MSNDLNACNLFKTLEAISAGGCSVLRTDRGNGSAGPAIISPDAVIFIEVDEVVTLDEIPSDVREEFETELAANKLGKLEDYTHVGIEREEETGWTGFYLLWIP